MKFRLLAASLAMIAIAVPAQAFTYFSLNGAPDPGLAKFEQSLVTFDAPSAKGITETDSGTVGLFTGTTSGVAAKPALDETKYLAVGAAGSATFDFTNYFSGKNIRSLSVYLGSIDLYNHIDVLAGSTAIGTINGADLPSHNGDQNAAVTNRRLYINFATAEGVTGLRFRSDGVAFEFDTIGASPAVVAPVPDGAMLKSLPPVGSGVGGVVPEPAAWMLMIAGFGLVGAAARRRRTDVVFA